MAVAAMTWVAFQYPQRLELSVYCVHGKDGHTQNASLLKDRDRKVEGKDIIISYLYQNATPTLNEYRLFHNNVNPLPTIDIAEFKNGTCLSFDYCGLCKVLIVAVQF